MLFDCVLRDRRDLSETIVAKGPKQLVLKGKALPGNIQPWGFPNGRFATRIRRYNDAGISYRCASVICGYERSDRYSATRALYRHGKFAVHRAAAATSPATSCRRKDDTAHARRVRRAQRRALRSYSSPVRGHSS